MSKGFTIPKKCRIECVVSAESTRYAGLGVYLDAVGKRLMATDGRKLVELPVDDMEGETTAVVPVDAIKLMRMTQGILHCDGKSVRVGGKGVETVFPLMEDVFPSSAGSLLDGAFNRRPEVVLCLDANHLKKVADAFGCSSVRLSMWTTKSTKPDEEVAVVLDGIGVAPLNGEAPLLKARGVLMPIMRPEFMHWSSE